MSLTHRSPSHLTDQQVAHMRALLVAELRSASEQAAEHEATARDLAGHMDTDSTTERELAQVCAVQARDTVQDVAYALRRLDAGTYGICERCQAPIPFERLEAIPQARFCVACPASGSRLLSSAGAFNGNLRSA